MGFFSKRFGSKATNTDETPAVPAWGGSFTSALLMHLRGEVDDALQIYSRILEESPEDPLAPFFTAAITAAKGETAQAAQTLRTLSKAVASADGSMSAAVYAALSQQLIDEPLIKYPQVAAVVVSLAEQLKKERFLQEAAVCLEIASTLVPDHADVLYKFGDLLHDMRMYEYAESVLGEALRQAPNHWDSLYTYAVLLQDLGRNEEALPYYEKAVKYNPDHVSCHNNYGAALFRTNRLDDALMQCSIAEKLDPASPLVKINLGNIYFVQQDFEAARNSFSEAIALNGSLAIAYFGLASVEKALGSPIERIRELYLKAVEINPAFTEAQQALEELGREEEGA